MIPLMTTETKVKWASFAVYVASSLGLILLDVVQAVDLGGNLAWLKVVLLPAVPTLAALLAGYQAKNKPASLAPSTLRAAESRLAVKLAQWRDPGSRS